MTDALHFVFIEIGKFRKTEKELVTDKEKWYFCFREMHRLESMPKELRSKVFERLFHLTEIASLPKEEQIEYIKEMTTERDIRNQIVYARDMGILEGEARGRAEGEAKGKAEGKAETALAMLANGLDIALVSKCTGLSEQQIEKMQKP